MKKGTIIRTIMQLLAYANQVIAIIGQTSFAKSDIYLWISVGLTIVVTGISYWYNNDWTGRAKMASKVYDILKDGKVTEEEVQNFVDVFKEDK